VISPHQKGEGQTRMRFLCSILICFCVLCIFISRFILGMFIYYLRVEERKKQKVLCGGWDVREHKRKKDFVTEKLGKCVGRVCGESVWREWGC